MGAVVHGDVFQSLNGYVKCVYCTIETDHGSRSTISDISRGDRRGGAVTL